jgi:DNA-binding transcriptional ArsR family regulator
VKDDVWSRAVTVKDRRAADALYRPFQRHLVLSLIGRDASVSELVSESGLSMRALHYQIVRLLKLGLLKIASRTRRGGRPIKRYTAAAEAFFVPEPLMTWRPGAVLERELRDALGRAHADGMLFYRDSAGAMSMRQVRTAPVDPRIAADLWQILNLDEREAKQLVADIRKLLDEVRTRPAHRRQRKYLLRWALLLRTGDDLFVS